MSLWLYPDDDHKGSIESRNFRKVVVLFERGLGEWFYLKEGSREGGDGGLELFVFREAMYSADIRIISLVQVSKSL